MILHRSAVALFVVVCGGGAFIGCGEDSGSDAASGERTEQKGESGNEAPTRGVATISAELAPLCVDRLGTAQQGDPATPEIAALVDDMVEAYRSGPQNTATTGRVNIARDNMRSGCGPDQESKLENVLEEQGEVPAPTREEADPDGSYEMNCDYTLPDDIESEDYRFIAGGTLENTGNVGIVVRATYEWDLLGQKDFKETKTYRLRRGQERDVDVSFPVTQDLIDAHQSADGKCDVRVKIIDSFGQPPFE